MSANTPTPRLAGTPERCPECGSSDVTGLIRPETMRCLHCWTYFRPVSPSPAGAPPEAEYARAAADPAFMADMAMLTDRPAGAPPERIGSCGHALGHGPGPKCGPCSLQDVFAEGPAGAGERATPEGGPGVAEYEAFLRNANTTRYPATPTARDDEGEQRCPYCGGTLQGRRFVGGDGVEDKCSECGAFVPLLPDAERQYFEEKARKAPRYSEDEVAALRRHLAEARDAGQRVDDQLIAAERRLAEAGAWALAWKEAAKAYHAEHRRGVEVMRHTYEFYGVPFPPPEGTALFDALVPAMEAERAALTATRQELDRLALRLKGADRLAKEADALIRRGALNARSPLADALLDYWDDAALRPAPEREGGRT